MGTIADKLTYLNGTKTAIKDAIVAKGVSVADSDTFRSYATKISEISGGGAATKYGVSIDNLLGNIDESGNYQQPTTTFAFEPGGDFGGARCLFGKFAYTGVNDVWIPWSSINGTEALRYAFMGCTQLTTVHFETGIIEGTDAMRECFKFCSNLTTVEFPNLDRLDGQSIMRYCFQGCTSLERIDFPILAGVSDADSFLYCFSGCTALKEIHFPVDLQSTIEGLQQYSGKFGATNATIYFDL